MGRTRPRDHAGRAHRPRRRPGPWREAKQRIADRILSQGVADGGYFPQTFGADEVDASLLRLPALGFIDAHDERMLKTVEVVQERLGTQPHGFLRRFEFDPAEAASSAAFLLCSFWLADVLDMQGRHDDAVALFERLLDTANDVGLLSEMVEADNGQLLGNFPQAFSHMALINTAYRLGFREAGRALPNSDQGIMSRIGGQPTAALSRSAQARSK